MAIAPNIYLVTVTGEYVDFQGNPIAGQVVFRVPKTLRNELADQILIPSSFVATLDSDGRFSAVLPASDDPDFHEQFEYTVLESFPGGRTFQAVLPEGLSYASFALNPYSFYVSTTYQFATGNFFDMTDLAPPFVVQPFVTLAAGSQFPFLEPRVVAQEAVIITTPPNEGIILAQAYDSVPVGYADYDALLPALVDYDDLAASVIVATSVGLEGFRLTAQGAQLSAEQGLLDTELVAARFPHPFVFTGVE